MVGIYKITNPDGKVYIGQSNNIAKRFKNHKQLSESKSKIYKSFKEFGYDNHVFEIIEECDISQLIIRESFYQTQYNSIKNGLNNSLSSPDKINLIEKYKNLGRKSVPPNEKKERFTVHMEKKKIDLLSYETCATIATTAINKEYDKKLRSKE
jgi:group I intron endonuclease